MKKKSTKKVEKKQRFHLPDYQVTVEARSKDEAIEKVKKSLSKK